MIQTNVHPEGAAAPAAAETKTSPPPATIKLGLDIHAKVFVVVAQHDHAMPRPPRRFAPAEFVPWVAGLLRQGHTAHVVYEACGFGFGLCRALQKEGAHCCVIAPRKLDEQRTGVKTDARDAATLCQRLSRYVDGNTRELAVIRVPSEEEEQLRHIHRQREAARPPTSPHDSLPPPRWCARAPRCRRRDAGSLSATASPPLRIGGARRHGTGCKSSSQAGSRFGWMFSGPCSKPSTSGSPP